MHVSTAVARRPAPATFLCASYTMPRSLSLCILYALSVCSPSTSLVKRWRNCVPKCNELWSIRRGEIGKAERMMEIRTTDKICYGVRVLSIIGNYWFLIYNPWFAGTILNMFLFLGNKIIYVFNHENILIASIKKSLNNFRLNKVRSPPDFSVKKFQKHMIFKLLNFPAKKFVIKVATHSDYLLFGLSNLFRNRYFSGLMCTFSFAFPQKFKQTWRARLRKNCANKFLFNDFIVWNSSSRNHSRILRRARGVPWWSWRSRRVKKRAESKGRAQDRFLVFHSKLETFEPMYCLPNPSSDKLISNFYTESASAGVWSI